MDELLINTIEDNLEELPEEVRDFIFGDELKGVKAELLQNVDSENDKLGLSNMIMFFLLGGKTEEDLVQYVQSLQISDEKKALILVTIQEKIINELLLTIEADKQIETESNESEKVSTVSSSSLTALSDRLKQASIAAPTNRTEYSINKPSSIPPAAPVPAPENTRTIDPYHEPIDNN